MALDFMGVGAKINEQMALQEAASTGLKSMEHLIRLVSHQQQPDCREFADSTVSKFTRAVSGSSRAGHARFRRAPVNQAPTSSTSSNPPPSVPVPSSWLFPQDLNLAPAPSPAQAPSAAVQSTPLTFQPQTLTLDFTKPTLVAANNLNQNDRIIKGCERAPTDSFSISPPVSTSMNSSSFMSSITGEGSVSNGKLGTSSMFIAPAPTNSAGKPPIGSKRCRDHDHSNSLSGRTSGSGSGKCHCRKRKSRVKTTIRVPAISSKIADIPADEYSWRKYGQKPIKGSPYPRGYYKCSTVRGCPARKHVERATDDPTMLIVTYEGEHRHMLGATQSSTSNFSAPSAGTLMVFESTRQNE